MERSLYWEIRVWRFWPIAMWVSHPGHRSFSPSQAFRCLKPQLTPWLQPRWVVFKFPAYRKFKKINVCCFKLTKLGETCCSVIDNNIASILFFFHFSCISSPSPVWIFCLQNISRTIYFSSLPCRHLCQPPSFTKAVSSQLLFLLH